MRFQGKNSEPECTARFCSANTTPTYQANPSNPSNPTIRLLEPQPPVVMKIEYRQEVIDNTHKDRNRQLRSQLDQARMQRELYRQTAETRKCAAPNVPATAKIRLLILLQKLQTLHVDYALLSQYFTDCMKGMDQNSSDVAVISSALIYEKPDLVNSDACYANALAAIKKTQTTNFTLVSNMVDGLSEIANDLRV